MIIHKAILALAFCLIFLSEIAVLGGEADYSADIQPIFAEKCYECHGPDKQKGDLRLDERDSTLASLTDGILIERLLTDDPDEQMPPKGPRLSNEQIEAIKTWAKAGAPFDQHWAYRPLNTTIETASKAENPIDHFVLARLAKEGISPSPPAERYLLIKRLYYDLLGLPPTEEAVDTFVNSTDPNSYIKLVDTLLASKHFGERWGRHWLDKARYADSDGYEKDRPRPNAWHYRDWVIDAINADMPMNQFTIEQLAGDLLPSPTPAQKLATAFHRQTLTNTEGGIDKEEFRTEAVFDRTETTATIWLGLTMNCARCHNHKYDNIQQVEYYQLYDFFNHGDESTFKFPGSPEAMEKYSKAKAAHEAKLKVIHTNLEKAKAGHEDQYTSWLAAFETQADRPKYHPLSDISVKSSATGTTFAIEPTTGIVQVGGTNSADPITYQLEAQTPAVAKPVTAIRLDALSHKSLPRKGPGRTAHGNFVLSEIELSLDGKPLTFSNVSADFSQNNYNASTIIDGNKTAKNGWAVSPQLGKPHYVTLSLATPISVAKGQKLAAALHQNYGNSHALGRFQIRLMTGRESKASQPKEIKNILSKAAKKRSKKDQGILQNYFFKTQFAPTIPIIKQRDNLAKNAPKDPSKQLRTISQSRSARATKLLERGSFLSPGKPVEPAGLSVLPEVPGRQKGKLDRLDLANWLMAEENPLPPRVLANHVWEKLFGDGLVRTMNDFGVRGEKPDYPALLDWLGSEYRRLGWSRKKLIRQIVTSSTYQQSSAHRQELLERDPNNHLLARQNRFRVEAEISRDLCLSIAGLMSDKIGGPSVFPPLPPEVAALSYNNNFKWKNSSGPDRYRRGMYTFFKRTSPHPNLIAFDCPDSNTSVVKRRTSNTPIQALTMLNNEVYIEVSQAFAKRILQLDIADDAKRVEKALRLCILRTPNPSEVEKFVDLLNESRKWYRDNPDAAAKMPGKFKVEEVDIAENAAWVSVARIALNLDELITRE